MELNRQFHARLYRPAGMLKMVELIDQLRGAVSYYVERAYQATEVADPAAADHEAILAACRRAERPAAAALAEHLEHSAVAAVVSAERLDRLAEVEL